MTSTSVESEYDPSTFPKLSNFPKLFNKYLRYIVYALIFILPLTIIVYLAIIGFDIEYITSISTTSPLFILWTSYLAIITLLTLNSLFAVLAFILQTRALTSKNMPIESSFGFRNVERKYKQKTYLTFIVFLLVLIAYLLFIATAWFGDNIASNMLKDPTKADEITTLLLYLTISGIIFSLAAEIVIPIPKLVTLRAGNLVEYYEPKRHPVVIKQLMYDGLYYLLDPVTRFSYVNWRTIIGNNIQEDFAPQLEEEERKVVAVQNILTLIYLNMRFPLLVDNSTLKREIYNIVKKEIADQKVFKGELNIKVWKKIFEILKAKFPDFFLIIDRILLTIAYNHTVIDENEFWITSAVPPTQIRGISEDILFLVLNRTGSQLSRQGKDISKIEFKDEKVVLEFYGGPNLSPDDFSTEFMVRRYDRYVNVERPIDLATKDIEEKHYGVKQLTAILFQSTIIWLTLHADTVGSNIATIKFLYEDKPLVVMNFDLTVVRGIQYYLRNWGPKILTSLGFIIPIIKAIIGF